MGLTAARSLIAQRRAVAWRLTPSSQPRESRDRVNPKNRASASLLASSGPATERHSPTQSLTNWSMKPMNKTLVCVAAISFALATSACSTTQLASANAAIQSGAAVIANINGAMPGACASAALIAGDVGSAVAKVGAANPDRDLRPAGRLDHQRHGGL